MKELTVSRTVFVHEEQAKKRSTSGHVVLLMLTSLGSFLCLFTGLSISLFSGIGVVEPSQKLAYVTIALLFGFFILIFLTAHLMDRLGSSDKEAKLRYVREHGLREEGLNDKDKRTRV